MIKLKLIITVGLLIVLISCGGNTTTKLNAGLPDDSLTQQIQPVSKKRGTAKLEIFNDIEQTRSKLSEIGIGNLGEWKDNGDGGYMSITNYYELSSSKENPNDLAYYLESDKVDNIQTLQLALDLNDASQKQTALKTFAETIDKTFKQLGVDIPKGLIKAVKVPSSFKADNDKFSTNLKLEKTKIDTWTMEIKTK